MEVTSSQYHSLEVKYKEQGLSLRTALDLLEKANDRMAEYRKTIYELKEQLKRHA